MESIGDILRRVRIGNRSLLSSTPMERALDDLADFRARQQLEREHRIPVDIVDAVDVAVNGESLAHQTQREIDRQRGGVVFDFTEQRGT